MSFPKLSALVAVLGLSLPFGGALEQIACADGPKVSAPSAESTSAPAKSASSFRPLSYDSIHDSDLLNALRLYRFPASAEKDGFAFSLGEVVFDPSSSQTTFTVTMDYHGAAPVQGPIKIRYMLCGAQVRHDGDWVGNCLLPAKTQVLVPADQTVQPGQHLTTKFTLQNPGFRDLKYYQPHVAIDLPNRQEELELGRFYAP